MRKITTYSALFFIFFGFAGIGGAVDLAESVTEPLILLAIGLILILVQIMTLLLRLCLMNQRQPSKLLSNH